jgi:hypothetical protein
MTPPNKLEYVDSFDPSKVAMIEQAIERAWEVLKQAEFTLAEEARSVLALCVMNEARSGEENHIILVDRAINQFRQQQAEFAILGHQNERRG